MIGALLALPAPGTPVPTTPAAFASAWQQDERSLTIAVDHWDKATRPTQAVTLLALYQQRMIRALAENRPLAARVEQRIPALVDDVTARAALNRLSEGTALPRRSLRVGPPAPAAALFGWYRDAQRRFGVRWQLLAAVNFVESAFGKVQDASSAGAQGPMQFLPATWRAYGLGGDIHDPRDAILGAANYLAANGGRRDERGALLHYNHSPLYVDAVSRYARRIAADANAFFEYYAWQVYERTSRGARRIGS